MSDPIIQFEQEPIPGSPAVTADDFSYRHPFSEDWTLTGITFGLQEGETLAVHGDSGSGKTTLFECITGFRPHMYRGGDYHGRLETLGHSVWDTSGSELLAQLGMVSQQFSTQALQLPVEEAIAFPMENAQIPRPQMIDMVDQLLATLEIGHLRYRRVKDLSGGERQAVVIATMLAKQGLRIMIFDNISSDLDPAGQRRIRSMIEMLRESGLTMIISESTAPEWLEHHVADRSLFLENGQVGYFGASSENPLPSYAYATGEFREPTNSPIAVTFENIVHTYDGTATALNGVTGEIKRGSIQGIIGPNGSGKTTLTQILSGVIRKPTEGTVWIGGEDPRQMRLQQLIRHISYIPQATVGTFFTDTVAEELQLTPRAIGIESSITPDMIGLSEFSDKQPNELSTGQRQRLAIGCALSSQPEILILDEPTKGLNQRELYALSLELIRLQEQGFTIILVSHDLRLIGSVATDIKFMESGQIIRDGSAREILNDRELFHTLDWPLPW